MQFDLKDSAAYIFPTNLSSTVVYENVYGILEYIEIIYDSANIMQNTKMILDINDALFTLEE